VNRTAKRPSRGKAPETGSPKHATRDPKSHLAKKWGQMVGATAVAQRDADGTPTLEKRSISTQKTAPWGLSKISYCNGDDDGFQQYTHNPTFIYDSSAGSGIRVYVVDTGILLGHNVSSSRGFSVYHYANVTGIRWSRGLGSKLRVRISGMCYRYRTKPTPNSHST
jgi:hypothetical protein